MKDFRDGHEHCKQMIISRACVSRERRTLNAELAV